MLGMEIEYFQKTTAKILTPSAKMLDYIV